MKNTVASAEGPGPRTVSLKGSAPAAWAEKGTARIALRPEPGAAANSRARFLQTGAADSGRERRNHMTLPAGPRDAWRSGAIVRAAARNPSDDHQRPEMLMRRMVDSLDQRRHNELRDLHPEVLDLPRRILKREWERVKDSPPPICMGRFGGEFGCSSSLVRCDDRC